jgi:serine/threonine protein kinase
MEAGSVLAGRYRLVSLIGRGGMGSVWKAEHLGLRAPVAVKLIDQSIAMLPEALSRFIAGLKRPPLCAARTWFRSSITGSTRRRESPSS